MDAPLTDVPLFHFTDPDPSALPSDFTATITWGDGTTSVVTGAASASGQIVGNSTTGFEVLGSHTYLQQASGLAFSVSVTDQSSYLNDFATAANLNDWTDYASGVEGAGITQVTSGSGLLPSAPPSGSSFAVVHNTDNAYSAGYYGGGGYTYFGGPQETYTGAFEQSVAIYINTTWAAPTPLPSFPAFWLDMAPSSQDPNNYGAEHNFRFYVDGSGSIAVTNDGSSSSDPIATISTSGWYTFQMKWYKAANPSDPALTDMNIYNSAGQLIGDRTALPATAPSGPLPSSELLGHGYAWITVWQNGFANDQLAIDNLQTSVQPISASASINVAPAVPMEVSFTPPAATAGVPFGPTTVFDFTDANPSLTAADFTAVVQTGDGNTYTNKSNPSIVQVAPDGSGGFAVQLTYTYAEALSSATFSVSVSDPGGATASDSTTQFAVTDALTAGALTPPTPFVDAPLTDVPLFHFTDPDPSALPSDFTATITWGDGTTSVVTGAASASGQIVGNSTTGFEVLGSHTYLQQASGLAFSVSVTDQSSYLNDFATAANLNDWTDYASGVEGAGITQVTSGSGLLPSAPPSGSSFAVVHNTDNAYSAGYYGGGGYTYFGGPQETYTGAFEQSVAIYINTTWAAPTPLPSFPAFWLDMAPSSQDPNNYGAEHNFRFYVDGSGSIAVTNDGSSSSDPIATISTSGWYTFQMKWYKAANPSDPALTDMNIYNSAGQLIGDRTALPATAPSGPLPSSELLGHGYAWITVWQNGFANDQLAIDNLQTSVQPISASASINVTQAPIAAAPPTPSPATNNSVSQTVQVTVVTPIPATAFRVSVLQSIAASLPISLTAVESLPAAFQISSLNVPVGQTIPFAPSGGGGVAASPAIDHAPAVILGGEQSSVPESSSQRSLAAGRAATAEATKGGGEDFEEAMREEERQFCAMGVGDLYDETALFGQLLIGPGLENDDLSFVVNNEEEDDDAMTTTALWFVLTTVACETAAMR